MIEFNNTEIAFKSKSSKDLNRAYWLFKTISFPSIVKIGKPITTFAFKAHLPIKGIVKKTIFKQFCGGETIGDCKPTVKLLNSYGIGSILDYSVEGKTMDTDFEKTTLEIIRTIQEAKNNPSIPYAVFKVTGIATFATLEAFNSSENNPTESEKKSFQGIFERVNRICQSGYENNVPVFIDAEETWIQDTIDRLCVTMMTKYNKEKAIVFNTLQMYRHDRIEYLEKCISEARLNEYYYGIKLVRGAYMEKERQRAKDQNYNSPIQPNKEATDRDYNKALEIIIENKDILSLCAGTHNEFSSSYLTELITNHNVEKADDRFYFAQLLGMSDHISFTLSNLGYNVAKYVPYGPIEEVLPYLLRRADENTSVSGQTSRELNLLESEKKRRKNLN